MSEELHDRLFKTGQRVPVEGDYVDQNGFVSHHQAHKTFGPCISEKNACAWRQLIRPVE